MYVTYLLRNDWTDFADLLFVIYIFIRGMFQQKNPYLWTGFSEKPEKSGQFIFYTKFVCKQTILDSGAAARG